MLLVPRAASCAPRAKSAANPPGELGAHVVPRRCRLEDRPVLHVVGAVPRVAAGLDVHPVLGLRQEPEVVVALDRVARVAVADAHLDVEDLGLGRRSVQPPAGRTRPPAAALGTGRGNRAPPATAARRCSWRCRRTSRTRRPRRTSPRPRRPGRRPVEGAEQVVVLVITRIACTPRRAGR